MKWTDKELGILKEGIENNLTFYEISQLLENRVENSIRLKAQRLGLKSKSKDNLKETKECLNCNIIFTSLKSEERKFCSSSCSTIYNNKLREKKETNIISCKNCSKDILLSKNINRVFCSKKCHRDYEYDERIILWKQNKLTGYKGKNKSIAPWLRKYLFNLRGAKCERCGWDVVHPIDGKPLVEINHIDGNAENNSENNLEILCPNCHSMTHNFRARNKNSTRIRN